MMIFLLIRNSLHVILIVSIVASQQLSNATHSLVDISTSAKNVTYIEIDAYLKPRRIQDINDVLPLPVWPDREYKMKKFPVFKRQVQEIILEIEENKEINNINIDPIFGVIDNGSWKNESEIRKSKLKSVLGTDGEVYYDADWGLMSAVLTCYNNHWALKTGPEDWWTVAIRRIVQAMDEHGEVPEVRDFFVQHKGKKKLNIIVGSSLSNIDYNWLFSQFSNGIKDNIKVPGYVDIIENNFGCSTDEHTMISQIMLMSSMKNYFSFGMSTMCGIPGVEMKGTYEDWAKLVNKINALENLLIPIEKHLGLEKWFNTAKTVFSNLLDTYRGQPNIEWWVQILSWNERWGSGMRPHWSGWFPEFVGVNPYALPYDHIHFPSDLVTVPIHIEDFNNPPPVEDDGILVAGIVGFNVEEGERPHPVVEPKHAWSLLLPEDSRVADRLTGRHRGPELTRHSTPHEELPSTHQTGPQTDTKPEADTDHVSRRDITGRQQNTNRDHTVIPTETKYDEFARSASSVHNVYHHHIANSNQIIFPTDNIPEANTDSNTGSETRRHINPAVTSDSDYISRSASTWRNANDQDPTNNNPSVNPAGTNFSAKKSCRYYSKRRDDKYSCSEIVDLRRFFARNTRKTFVIRVDEIPENVCPEWCVGSDNERFCCLSAEQHGLL